VALSPKAGGAVGVVVAVVALGLTWYTVTIKGTFYVMLAMLGPALLPLSLATVLLPTRLLMVPTEVEGRVEYNTQNPKFTPLGWFIFGSGICAGVGLLVYLKSGL
jgi:hypothetical protein